MGLRSILVTGGAGFLGSAICRALSLKHPKCRVVALDACPPDRTHTLPTDVRYVQADITSIDNVCEVIGKVEPQVVIHSAAVVGDVTLRYGRKERDKIWHVNVTGTKNVLEAAKKAGVEALVHTSSIAAVMDDLNSSFLNVDERWPTCHSSLPYGESKAAAEELVLGSVSDGFATCSLRPSPLFGPGDYLVLPRVYACIAAGETPFVIGADFRLWDITYVDNAADAHVLAAENLVSSKTAAGEAFFIQNNEPIPFRDFCLAIWASFGHIPSYEIQVPVFLALSAGFIADMVACITGTPLSWGYGSVKEYCSTRYASGEKAKRILGYEAQVGLEEGIRISCEDYAQRNGVTLPGSSEIGIEAKRRRRFPT